MPPWVIETEIHTMGAFMLIRGREEIEDPAEVCAAEVVGISVVCPVSMVTEASVPNQLMSYFIHFIHLRQALSSLIY